MCFDKRYVEYPSNATPIMPNSPPLSGRSDRMPVPPTSDRTEVRMSEPHAAHPIPRDPVIKPVTPAAIPPLVIFL